MSDFYGIEQLLTDAGRDAVQRTREYMTKEVEPVINRLWTREEFPFELLPGLARLGIAGARASGRPVRRGRGGDLLLRGHQGDQHPRGRARDHRPERLRVRLARAMMVP
jgi:hypothetical protein